MAYINKNFHIINFVGVEIVDNGEGQFLVTPTIVAVS